jgi:uncharacterized protein (TIGR02145 family)
MIIIQMSCTKNSNIEENKLPECTILSPKTGETYSNGSIVEIEFNVVDEDGQIKGISILIDSIEVFASDTIFEKYSWDTKNIDCGLHRIQILVTDDQLGENSAEITITITAEPDSYIGDNGYFTDSRDCQKYGWVRIGDQVWMSENLNFSTNDSYVYNDDDANAEIYGRFYPWKIASKSCPLGWHLPSDNEWKELEISLGMNPVLADSGGNRFSDVACKLKTADTIFWSSPNYCATNESGFSALPAGSMEFFLSKINYKGIGYSARFWSSTECGVVTDGDGQIVDYFSWIRQLHYSNNAIARYAYGQSDAISVRCVKDK